MAGDPALAANLKLAKTKEMYFAFVAKGSEGKLLVDKKKIPAKEIADAKKESGGGTIYQGRLKGEDGTMVFEVAKPVAAPIVALTKKVIKAEAGLMLDVEYRVAADLSAEEDSAASADAAAGAPPPAPPPPPIAAGTPPPAPPPPPVAEGGPRFVARLKALAPVMQKVETVNKEAAAQAKAQVAEGNKAYLAKNYDAANAALDTAETLLKQGLTAAVKGTAPPPPPSPVDNLEKRVLGRLKALEPVLTKIEPLKSQEAKDVRQAIKEANGFVAKKDFESANGTLDIAESMIKDVLKSLAGSAPPAGGREKGTFVAFTQARLKWDSARKTVQAELAKLEQSILDTFKNLPKIPPAKLAELANSAKKLYTILDKLDERLIDKLDEALNAQTPEARTKVNKEAGDIVKEYQAFVNSDPLVNDIDGNPFTSVNVRGFLVQTLADLSARLA